MLVSRPSDIATPKGYVYRRMRHTRPCPAWRTATRRAERYEAAIVGQLSQLQLDDQALARVRGLAALEGMPAPATDALRRRQLERELADKATRHARREMPTDLYLAEHARITAELDAVQTSPSVSPGVDPEVAVAALRDLAAVWRDASEEARAHLIRAVYARISVDSERVVAVELTPEAYRHGFDQVLPEVVSLARPAGFEPAT